MFTKQFSATRVVMTAFFMILMFVAKSDAFFRHICHGEVGVGRIDPIVSAGEASAHCHGIHGAQSKSPQIVPSEVANELQTWASRQTTNSYLLPTVLAVQFGKTSLLTGRHISISSMPTVHCSWSPNPAASQRELSCSASQNPLTNYWFSYYFTDRLSDLPEVDLVAFPPGFRMVAGNNMKRAYYNGTHNQTQPPYKKSWTQFDIEQQSRMEDVIGFNCLNYKVPAENAMLRHEMPEKAFIDAHCDDGVRAEIMFPTCWNGELDSANHADHVAYPTMPRNGACPPGYDKRFAALFFETVYFTPMFNGVDGEYIFANGDPTGLGYHADFVNGWEPGVLQAAIDSHECSHGGSQGEQSACPVFDIKPDEEVYSCKMEIPEAIQAEQVDFVEFLPGNPAIHAGPGFAPLPSKPNAPVPVAVTSAPVSVGTGYDTGSAITSVSAVPPYPIPANETSITQAPAPPASAEAVSNGAGHFLTFTEYRIDGNQTIQVDIVQKVVVLTVTMTPTSMEMALATDSTALAGPVKRSGHVHGRVHV